MITQIAGDVRATEIGSLTSRLMVEVESAATMLSEMAQAPRPRSADEAEETVLRIVTLGGIPFRTWPVNEKTYEDIVSEAFLEWTPAVVERTGITFGPQFCMAAAQLALRAPARLRAKSLGPNASTGDLRRAVEDLPRYLAWIAALGYADSHTWIPAVAGDIARRLTWWRLDPHPSRGAGRLLWLLEKTLDPHHRQAQMQDLWNRARRAGFTAPDHINTPPGDVDVSAAGLQEILKGRADLSISPPAAASAGITDPAQHPDQDVASDRSTAQRSARQHIHHSSSTRRTRMPSSAGGRTHPQGRRRPFPVLQGRGLRLLQPRGDVEQNKNRSTRFRRHATS